MAEIPDNKEEYDKLFKNPNKFLDPLRSFLNPFNDLPPELRNKIPVLDAKQKELDAHGMVSSARKIRAQVILLVANERKRQENPRPAKPWEIAAANKSRLKK